MTGGSLPAAGWPWIRGFLGFFLLNPPDVPEFHALQYTFLSQIGHREDFRARLASLYEEWRSNLAEGLARDLDREPAGRPVPPRALATVVQALLHGLTMQLAADPNACRPEEVVELCLDML